MTNNDLWRRRLAIVWVLGAVVAGRLEYDAFTDARGDLAMLLLLPMFVGALVLSLFTVRVLQPTRRIDALDVRMRRVYRGALGFTIAAALFGFVWSVVGVSNSDGIPMITATSAVYFLGIAILAYRALAATTPQRAVGVVVAVLLTWLPAMVVAMIALDTSHDSKVTWNAGSTAVALTGVLYGVCLVAAATLVAFRRVDVVIPEARTLEV